MPNLLSCSTIAILASEDEAKKYAIELPNIPPPMTTTSK
jgi:hypothetical protein